MKHAVINSTTSFLGMHEILNLWIMESVSAVFLWLKKFKKKKKITVEEAQKQPESKQHQNGGNLKKIKKQKKKNKKKRFSSGDRERNGQAGHFLPHWSAVWLSAGTNW